MGRSWDRLVVDTVHAEAEAQLTGRPFTIGARVNATQRARIDAAACLAQKTRADFIAGSVLRAAEQVLRGAVCERLPESATPARADR